MSDLRALIRELLSEEIAALRAELSGAAGPREERVCVDDARALTDFALSVLRRASDPGFASALQDGRLTFVPAGAPISAAARAPVPAAAPQPSVMVTTVPATVPELAKSLITERDIAQLPHDATRLRIGKRSRLTPLAADETRRRSIRIERTLA